ncbi:MAG: DUF5063 domain-containing protein, partial [Cyclobacteriaceae bacterium]
SGGHTHFSWALEAIGPRSKIPMNIQEAIEMKETTAFLEAASEFCGELENGTANQLEFCNELFIKLSNLIFRASQLAQVSLDYDKDSKGRLTEEEQKIVLKKTSDRIGDHQYYWTKFNPIDNDVMELVAGDLVDDLGDIYADIKPNLRTLEQGELAEQESALWELKFFFETHWGHHAVDALRTLYFITKN